MGHGTEQRQTTGTFSGMTDVMSTYNCGESNVNKYTSWTCSDTEARTRHDRQTLLAHASLHDPLRPHLPTQQTSLIQHGPRQKICAEEVERTLSAHNSRELSKRLDTCLVHSGKQHPTRFDPSCGDLGAPDHSDGPPQKRRENLTSTNMIDDDSIRGTMMNASTIPILTKPLPDTGQMM